jgi:23S rRNA (adenine2030-N6)-methyltransferase
VKVLREDGLEGCIGLVPPPERRALLLVDPSYELRDEHAKVIDACIKAHKRFATGVIAIWYPVIERRFVERYERALRTAGFRELAVYELCVARATPAGGLTGSGMFVVNAPWQLDDELQTALPWLAERLARDTGAGFRAAPAA